ncbi:MAG TPA: ribbon-helix-helix domain-containing protein [Stellaceae bacterium]|nr:ribbon-helix-helix domain-containing protein [Stellaceae bacterium]
MRIACGISSRVATRKRGKSGVAGVARIGNVAAMEARVVKHSVRIAGHATSVSLEAAFWEALQAIAARRGVSVNALLAGVDRARGGNLSSAIRLFVLDCCRRGELPPDPKD